VRIIIILINININVNMMRTFGFTKDPFNVHCPLTGYGWSPDVQIERLWGNDNILFLVQTLCRNFWLNWYLKTLVRSFVI